MVKYDFEDRVIVVTGGANGIGAAAIKKFIRFGGRVHNWDKLDSNISGVNNHRVDISVSKSIQKALLNTLKKDVVKFFTCLTFIYRPTVSPPEKLLKLRRGAPEKLRTGSMAYHGA